MQRRISLISIGLSVLYSFLFVNTVAAQSGNTLKTAVMNRDILDRAAADEFASPLIDGDTQFTARDLTQSVSELTRILRPRSGEDLYIRSSGTYLISGSFRESMIVVEAGEDDKVQLVFDGLNITNSSKPAVFVNSADKVFLTTRGDSSTLEVTGVYASHPDASLDAVIFSRSDLVINGTGSLTITSLKGNGITSKDDLKITGGVLAVHSELDGIEANDSIRIHNGGITVVSGKDGLHSENSDDPYLGYIYIRGGRLQLTAVDDGIQANSFLQIDGGRIDVERSSEGMEANLIQINDGAIDIYASDDGINAAVKGPMPAVAIAVNGGSVSVEVGPGDTDAFDANGDIYINGGRVNAVGRSTFDADRQALFNGGRVFVNGEEVSELPVSRWGRRN